MKSIKETHPSLYANTEIQTIGFDNAFDETEGDHRLWCLVDDVQNDTIDKSVLRKAILKIHIGYTDDPDWANQLLKELELEVKK